MKYYIKALNARGKVALIKHMREVAAMGKEKREEAARMGILDHDVVTPTTLMIEVSDEYPVQDVRMKIGEVMHENGARLIDYTVEVLP